MKDFLKHNGILILVIAVLLSLITTVFSLTFGGMADPLSDVIEVISTPFRNGIHAFVRWSEERYSDAFELESMKSELEELRKENAELKQQARDGQAALDENARLRDLLGYLEKHSELHTLPATVAARGSSNWSSTLTISVGSSSEVEVGSCVIDQYGNLVGVISEVGSTWSTVSTVVDVDMEMGGLISRTRDAAILEGDFTLMGAGKLKLTYLPEDVQLLSGDTIVTSGLLSGGSATYPSGIVVGYVEDILSDDSGMTDYAVLSPATDLGSLEQVFVVRSFDIVE